MLGLWEQEIQISMVRMLTHLKKGGGNMQEGIGNVSKGMET